MSPNDAVNLDWLWVGVVLAGALTILVFWGYILWTLMCRLAPYVVVMAITLYVIVHSKRITKDMEEASQAIQEVESILKGEDKEPS